MGIRRKLKEVEFVAIFKGRSLYRLFLVDIKRVFKLVKKKGISIPVFKERTAFRCPTEADEEDNGDHDD
jgi:hypothetical protein